MLINISKSNSFLQSLTLTHNFGVARFTVYCPLINPNTVSRSQVFQRPLAYFTLKEKAIYEVYITNKV